MLEEERGTENEEILVSKCSSCPYYHLLVVGDWTGHIKDFCEEADLPIEDENSIPEWCPLEDE